MLELTGIHLEAAGRVLVADLSARVAPGEVLAVMGDSGSGKSSLLAYLCGTLAPGLSGRGQIRLFDIAIDRLPTVRRRVAILFQDDLLFPHLSVQDNLLFALPTGGAPGRSASRGQRLALAQQALAAAGLEGFGERRPHTLSGGQRARVSVLRALLAEPRAVLLDEPFARLDAALRERFRAFVFERIRALQIPAVLVTHDPLDVPAGAQCIRLGPESAHA
jgi:putative thiamine transport system ATP-binding protein